MKLRVVCSCGVWRCAAAGCAAAECSRVVCSRGVCSRGVCSCGVQKSGGWHLVLELVTLALEVKRMVQVLVNLLRLAVLLEHATQHAHPPQPQLLDGHASLLATLPLAVTCVAALALGVGVGVGTETRVHLLRLADDEAILDQLPDVLAYESHGESTAQSCSRAASWAAGMCCIVGGSGGR